MINYLGAEQLHKLEVYDHLVYDHCTSDFNPLLACWSISPLTNSGTAIHCCFYLVDTYGIVTQCLRMLCQRYTNILADSDRSV